MTDKITLGQLYPGALPPKPAGKPTAPADAGMSFQQILQDKVVKLSHHAEVRLQQRGIDLLPDQLAKLQAAVDKAAAKGGKDSLILMNGMAFIVNVKNRTVVTAMDGSAMKDNVFTQIDSAVVVS